MPPRKRSRTARPATAPVEQPVEQPVPDSGVPADPPIAAAVDEDTSVTAPVPVQRVRIRPAEPVRAGGHVLTERGWVPED